MAGRRRRMLVRAAGVFGVLSVVFCLRLDAAVRTAHTSNWQGRTAGSTTCTDCFLPSVGWVAAHGVATIAALGLLLFAVVYARSWQANHTLIVICSVLVSLLAVGATVLRVLADVDVWWSALGVAAALELAAFAVLAVIVAIAYAARGPGSPSIAARLRRFVGRYRVNVVGVTIFALVLTAVPRMKDQAVDSLRVWVTWHGMSRLSFGLASAVLLAVVVYESSVRLSQLDDATPDDVAQQEPFDRWKWLWRGAILLILGVILRLTLPIGAGIAIAGALLLLFSALDLGGVETSPGEEEEAEEPLAPALGGLPPAPAPEPAAAPEPAPEWLAVIPLVAICAAGVTAGTEAALSDGIHLQFTSTLVFIPVLVLAFVAIGMTGDGTAQTLPALDFRRGLVGTMCIAGGITVLLFALRHQLPDVVDRLAAASAGFTALGLVLGYVWLLFYRANPPAGLLVSIPSAVAAGTVTLIAIHYDVHAAADTLGVFGLINIATASLLALLHYAMAWSIAHRPPYFLESLSFRQVPVLTLLLVWWVAAGTIAPQKQIHDLRLSTRMAVAQGAGEPTVRPNGPTLDQAFQAWMSAQGPDLASAPASDGPVPLVLVAAHGGGIRAAYWTALALDCAVGGDSAAAAGNAPSYQDVCTKTRQPDVVQRTAARRIFAASGVSGGAVGLYAYARQLRRAGDLGAGAWVASRLGGDFASDTVGWALFHDLPNHLLGSSSWPGGVCSLHVPFTHQCLTMDRAAVLEDAFDSRKLAADPGPDPVRLLRRTWDLRSSANAAERSTADEVPLLIFNSTVVGGNTRAVTSALQLSDWPKPEQSELTANSDRDLHPLAGNAQVTAALCGGKDLRLSTAAILAGRFPFVSPSARITPQCSSTVVSDQNCATAVPPCEMELVDGGYTDNSGLFSLEAMVPTLRALVREHNEANKAHRPIALVLVELDNHFRASINQAPSASSTTGQTLAPLATAFGGHAAIENYARAEAYRVVPPGCTITISPGLHPGLSAPVGWELSAATRKDLREGLVRKRANLDDAAVQPVTLLRKLQGWFTNSQNLSPCVPD